MLYAICTWNAFEYRHFMARDLDLDINMVISTRLQASSPHGLIFIAFCGPGIGFEYKHDDFRPFTGGSSPAT